MAYDRKLNTDIERIKEQGRIVSSNKIAEIVSEYADDFVGILNSTRQFVTVNDDYFSNGMVIANIIGMRPGEILGCIHSHESAYGCGNSAACGYCGAAITIEEALETRRKVSRDGRLLVGPGGSQTLNVRIKAVPLEYEDETFALLFIRDISKEKHVELMERAFFHDVLNSSISLKSLFSVSEVSSEYIPDADRSIELNITDIVEQIQYFQKLKKAETGELSVVKESVEPAAEISDIVQAAGSTAWAEGKAVETEFPDEDIEITTDRILFRRIVLNLLKNALEASRRGDTVRIALEAGEQDCLLSVRNPAVMPEEVRSQIFQRSFSTKGAGRGVGTYSIKMLGERYLGGKVDFSSTETGGTVFRFRLPLYND